jgi:hypothetical protein
MSVRTTADEILDRVKHNVNEAANDLSKIVVGKEWGSNDFNPEYQKTLKESLFTLLKIRDDLK